MAIQMYDLTLRQWVNTNPVSNSSAASPQNLLVNLFIEMRIQTYYLEAIARGFTLNDDPQTMRVDVTQDWPING